MLRFAESLRKMVDDGKDDPKAMRNEAENLVATKIEPVVREAVQRAKDMAEQKFRNFYTGVAKSSDFGFIVYRPQIHQQRCFTGSRNCSDGCAKT
jgi:hypothetical protein